MLIPRHTQLFKLCCAHRDSTDIKINGHHLQRHYLILNDLRSTQYGIEGAAEAFLAPMMMSEGEGKASVWVKEAGRPPCYGQSDWAAVVPRSLAPIYFTAFPGAALHDCEWYVIGSGIGIDWLWDLVNAQPPPPPPPPPYTITIRHCFALQRSLPLDCITNVHDHTAATYSRRIPPPPTVQAPSAWPLSFRRV